METEVLDSLHKKYENVANTAIVVPSLETVNDVLEMEVDQNLAAGDKELVCI